ncbi:MAG: L,D-transpeptidase, partial [Phycisphaerales bacterium]
EEVRFIQYFAHGQGLHAASWHDAFGQPVTHGCVNLSTTDAQWLFDWAPPRLPVGWHTRWPLAKAEESLWVFVERTSRHLADGGLRAASAP